MSKIGRHCSRGYSYSNSYNSNESYSDWEEFNDSDDLTRDWNPVEDEKLVKLVRQHGEDSWAQIAMSLPDRSDLQCQKRWERYLNPRINDKPWCKEEDIQLTDLVTRKGIKQWSVISESFHNRTAQQCKDRWIKTYLNSNNQWTEEDNKLLTDLHDQYGDRWGEIAERFPGRTESAVKNRYFSNHKNRLNVVIKEEPEVRHTFLSPIRHVSPINMDHAYFMDFEGSTQLPFGSYSTSANNKDAQAPPSKELSVPVLGNFSELQTPKGNELIYGKLSPEVYQRINQRQITPIKFSSLTSGSIDRARIDKNSLSTLNSEGLIPITSPVFKQTPAPNILRRKKDSPRQVNRSNISMESNSNQKSVIHNISLHSLNTPPKCLPFSPSKFFNSPIGPSLKKALTSTPVCSKPFGSTTPITHQSSPMMLKRPMRTPLAKKNIFNSGNEAHTPTPFKRALLAVEQRNGAVTNENHTPMHIYDDLQAVIACDTGNAAFQADLSRRFGSYRLIRDTARVTKNLEQKLAMPAHLRGIPGFTPETPSKSLVGDKTMGFSPPSILKDTFNDAFNTTKSPLLVKSNRYSSNRGINLSYSNLLSGDITQRPGYYMIACGQTEDQYLITQIAESWLKLDSTHRPLTLF